MAPLDACRELMQCYLVNKNSTVGGCWCGSWQGWLRWPRPGSGCRRQPGLCRWPPGPALTGPPPAPPTGEPRCTGGRSGVACGWIMGRERPYHLYSECGGMYVIGLVLRANGCGGMYCWGTNLCVCV
jgi:hypothetical protein